MLRSLNPLSRSSIDMKRRICGSVPAGTMHDLAGCCRAAGSASDLDHTQIWSDEDALLCLMSCKSNFQSLHSFPLPSSHQAMMSSHPHVITWPFTHLGHILSSSIRKALFPVFALENKHPDSANRAASPCAPEIIQQNLGLPVHPDPLHQAGSKDELRWATNCRPCQLRGEERRD